MYAVIVLSCHGEITLQGDKGDIKTCQVITSFFTFSHVLQVVQSMQALLQPVRLQRLTIQPVNLLVSIHASLKLYIASDHTPLSFSVFERGPVFTTARQLVHALAMHYAAGALFRAGRLKTKTVLKLNSPLNVSRSPAATSSTHYLWMGVYVTAAK